MPPNLRLTNPFASTSDPVVPRRWAGTTGAVLLGALVLGIVVVVVYWGGLRGEFLGPDHALFNRSPLMSAPPSPGSTAGFLPSWLPRTTAVLSLALDRVLWGPLPAGFRTTSLVLHWLTSVLVLVVGLRWMRRAAAATAALLFAVHPLHVAAVDVAGARGEILATLFSLLALLCLSFARDEDPEPAWDAGPSTFASKPRPKGTLGMDLESGAGSMPSARHAAQATASSTSRSGWLAAAFGACLAASFSSPLALTLPVVIVLADLFSATHASENLALRAKVWISMTVACIPAALAGLMLAPPAAPLNRWLTGRALLESLRLLIVPYPLPLYRMIGPGAGVDALSLLALAVALGVLAALFLLSRGRALPFPRIALLLAVVPILALALLPPAAQGPDVPFALLEERLYLSSAGACLVLAGLLDWAVARAGARTPSARLLTAGALAGLVCLVFGVLAASRHPVFENDASYYSAAAADSPGSMVVRVRLAEAAAARGQADKGLMVLKPLVDQRPSDPDLHLLLANLHRDARDLESAEAEAREALRLRPSFARAHGTLGLIEREKGNAPGAESAYREAIRLDPSLAEAHNNLGALLASRSEPLEALEEMKKALELDPTLGDAAANLASFLVDQKRPDEAIDVLRRALVYSEANARLHYVLGVALQTEGKRSEAASSYERAIELNPGYARPVNNLAILLTEEGRYDEAVVLLRHLTELEPTNERARYNLGIVYRSRGDTRQAAAEFAAALRIRPDYADASRALSEMANTPRDPAAGR